jgi:hypothetical protein
MAPSDEATADDATTDGAAGPGHAEGEAREVSHDDFPEVPAAAADDAAGTNETPTPDSTEQSSQPVEDPKPTVVARDEGPAADDTSTQSISVVAKATSEDLSTTALPVVEAKSR